MKTKWHCQENEEGFVLIAALLILLVLTVIGITANRNTLTEWRIAMNDRTHKDTFYEADGGTELASELLEQNIACLEFGADGAGQGKTLAGAAGYTLYVDNDSLGFWRNFAPIDLPSDSSRDFYFSDYPYVPGTNDGEPHTNFKVGGDTRLTTGAAIQMAAGYEGRGKGIGVGGATLVYDINSQHQGRDNSETMICVQYRHTLGQEGDCYYW